jgi:hypothetical protein
MNTVNIKVSGLKAQALGIHLLLVIKHYVAGKKAGSIAPESMELLRAMDQAYLKLSQLGERPDDETPQPIALTIIEAEATLRAFTDDAFKDPALEDEYYQKNSYTSYFGLIYAPFLEKLSAGYVEALAAA